MDILGVFLSKIVGGVFGQLESPIRELNVTIKSRQTYMNLTDVFFKQAFAIDL